MHEVLDAWSAFFSQPFGVVGAICVMAAVTVINSRALRDRLAMTDAAIVYLFNGLNLVGGVCLFANAVVRSEIVWLVLETYFVAIALKGIRQTMTAPNAAAPVGEHAEIVAPEQTPPELGLCSCRPSTSAQSQEAPSVSTTPGKPNVAHQEPDQLIEA